MDFYLDFLDFLDFLGFLDFLKFFGFFSSSFFLLRFVGIPFKVTKITTKSYQGYYWTPTIAKNGPKQHNKLSFLLPAGARSRPA